jgi:hypothetical protein
MLTYEMYRFCSISASSSAMPALLFNRPSVSVGYKKIENKIIYSPSLSLSHSLFLSFSLSFEVIFLLYLFLDRFAVFVFSPFINIRRLPDKKEKKESRSVFLSLSV